VKYGEGEKGEEEKVEGLGEGRGTGRREGEGEKGGGREKRRINGKGGFSRKLKRENF